MLNQTGFILLPSADNTCSHCHTLLPAQRTCFHSNCDRFQLLPWQRSSTPPSNLLRQRGWHLWEAKGHSALERKWRWRVSIGPVTCHYSRECSRTETWSTLSWTASLPLSSILWTTHTCTHIKWLAWIFFPRCYYFFRAMLVQRTWCCVIRASIVIAHWLRVSVSVVGFFKCILYAVILLIRIAVNWTCSLFDH